MTYIYIHYQSETMFHYFVGYIMISKIPFSHPDSLADITKEY